MNKDNGKSLIFFYIRLMVVKIDKSWNTILKSEFDSPYFKDLLSFLERAYSNQTIYPPSASIFRAFDACPFKEVKVVILGQDPYHTKGMADGLCFSVPSDVTKLPPSLRNIFKELEDDVKGAKKVNGNLIHWANQGVLLLNTVLTVEDGTANSHAGMGWERFTDAVINELNNRKKNIVYILWGSNAISKSKTLNKEDNLILTAPHPSPLSSYRGFFGSKPFSKTNEYLRSKSLKEISW